MAEEGSISTDRQSSLKELIQVSESFPFGLLVFHSSEIIDCNTCLAESCGYSGKNDLLKSTNGKIGNLLIHSESDHSGNGIARLKGKDGTEITCHFTSKAEPDMTVLYLSSFDAEQDQNLIDSISGLYQKEYLFHTTNSQIADPSSRFHKGSWSMIFVNISGFRGFNDENGYTEGNHLLRSFAELLISIFNTKLATRIYADQFAVLYEGKDAEEKVNVLHEKALELKEDFNVWVHAGIYEIKGWNLSLDVILDYARTACAVSHKTHQFSCTYSEELQKQLEKRKYIITHIDEAIAKGWIVLYFQPVVRTLSGKICSGEALTRWIDPVYGMISPGEFVPVLEESRLSYKLAQFVIDAAAGYISEAERMGMYPIPVSINLSRRDFDDMEPFSAIENAVKKYGISRNLLCIEITESTVMDNPDKIRSYITRFHEAGYEVWMDDFGSAYSSLNALKDFDFDEIKLDMVFMRNFNERAKKIVSSCINMAKDLGIHTLCEGVETKEQVEFLLEHGCEKIQGFYYSKPRPVHELKEMIDSGKFGYELSVERFLYDEAGKIKMDPDTASMVVLRLHNSLYPLEISRCLQEEIKKIDLPEVSLRKPLPLEETEIGHKMDCLIRNCHESGRKEEVSYFLNGNYYVLSAVQASQSNAGYICAVQINDITESARSLLLGNADVFTQSMTSIYDCIYRLDSSCDEIQVLVSDFSGEAAGKSFPFDPDEMSAFIYWKDRARFQKWIDISGIQSFLQDAGRKSISDLFRLEKTDGRRSWELFTLIRSTERKKEELYLCMKPADASMSAMAEMTAEKEGFAKASLPEEQTAEEHAAESFFNALLEQKALKIFRKDKNRKFTNVSRSFLSYFGLSSLDSILGKTMEECPWLLDEKGAREKEEVVLLKGKESSFAPSKVLVNGIARNTIVLEFPIYNNSRVNGIAGIFMDEEEMQNALGSKKQPSFIDHDTGAMNFLAWIGELSSFEDQYNHLEKDYAVGVLMIRNYWKTYHEFGRRTAEKMAKIAVETIRSRLSGDCMIGRLDKETFVIATMNPKINLKEELNKVSSLLSSTHYIDAYEGSISSLSASCFRSETSNLMRAVTLALEKAENRQKLLTMSNERNPRISAVQPETPEDSILTLKEAEERIQVLLHSFDFVRLSDPERKKIIRYERNGVWKEQQGNCFDVWQTGIPCENCVSRRALKTKEKLTKFETDGENIFIVIAQYLEVEGRPCVLEMVMRMHDASSLGSDERGIFIRALSNCRARMYEDSLTNLHNRRYYEDILAEHTADACALIDIDNMKHVNESWGHLAGDTALCKTAQAIASCVNVHDLVRYEGDCFLVGFSRMSQKECQASLQNILDRISEIHFDTWPLLRIKAYAGCVYRTDKIMNLIQEADKALAKAENTKSDMIITDAKEDGI